MLPINSKWNSGLVTRHFKTGDPKSSREMIICKKQGQPMRRRYFVAVCWRKHAARWQYDFTEAHMTHDEPDSAAASALAVMERHLHALNGLRENDLADTLHFPHFRLVGTTLDCWPAAETYLSDFRARSGDHWARTAWQKIDVQRESADKVHLVVQINRFDINDQLIANFDSLWVITFKNGKWAAQFRSSFAAS